MTNKVRALGVAAAVTVGLSACTTGGAGGTGTIQTAINAAPTTFSPWTAETRDDYDVSRLLFDTLVRRGADNKIVPALATSWESTPTEASFTIRDGATCADGTPITAEVVQNSLHAMATAEGSVFRKIVFGPGRPTISADNAAKTVTVELAQPWQDLVQGMSLVATGIVCPAGLENPEGLRRGSVKGAFSGPYVLSASSHGVSYTFALRKGFTGWPDYGDTASRGKPAQTVQVDVMPNGSSRANALLTGGMDIGTISTQDMTRFDGDEGYTAQRLPSSSLFVLFNEREGTVFADEEVRRAVVQTLSRKSFNSAATAGLGDLATTFSHDAVPCASTDSSVLIEQDVEAAKPVLRGKTIRILGLEVIGPQGAGNTYIAEALRAAGATVEIDNVDVATWSTTGTGEPDAWDLTVFAGINAGGTMYGALSPVVGPPTEAGGANWSGTEHKDVLAMVDEAMREPDDRTRCGIYQRVQETLIEGAHVMPLSYLPAQLTTRSGFSVQVHNDQVDVATMQIDGEG
ncbi:ABC transporter substrate-binding protein [Prauserella cavernicola]|uniref:ABC transporter substrate-binding protein n=1 Tax=Prauserella cavernicola TaxID=2800127 RepID=A0A934QZL5_9PSEU|nr:ABC transporter substrate-binding protein [Prauserella cavernicola]MBK1789155.1 ABC transporter substrate-binding protein [Prauserella cavernicola]